jgi:hypothetical protein
MFFDEIYANFNRLTNNEKEEVKNIIISYLENIANIVKDKEYIQNKIKEIKDIKVESIIDVQKIHKIMLQISLDSTNNKNIRIRGNSPVNSDPWIYLPRAKEFVENIKKRR